MIGSLTSQFCLGVGFGFLGGFAFCWLLFRKRIKPKEE